MKTTVATIMAILRPNDSIKGKPRRAPPNAPAWKVETMLAEMFCRVKERKQGKSASESRSLTQENVAGRTSDWLLVSPLSPKSRVKEGRVMVVLYKKSQKWRCQDSTCAWTLKRTRGADEPDVGRVVAEETGSKRDSDGAQVDSCIAGRKIAESRQGSVRLSWKGVRKSGRQRRTTSQRP